MRKNTVIMDFKPAAPRVKSVSVGPIHIDLRGPGPYEIRRDHAFVVSHYLEPITQEPVKTVQAEKKKKPEGKE